MSKLSKRRFMKSALHIFWPITSFGNRVEQQTSWARVLVHSTTAARVIFGTIGWIWIKSILFVSAIKRNWKIITTTLNGNETKRTKIKWTSTGHLGQTISYVLFCEAIFSIKFWDNFVMMEVIKRENFECFSVNGTECVIH